MKIPCAFLFGLPFLLYLWFPTIIFQASRGTIKLYTNPNEVMSLIKEFKKFVIRGNVIDLSVGMIMGGAFGKMVTSIVEDLFMPMINPFLVTDRNWQSIVIGPGIKIGQFVAALLNFLVISLVIFALIRVIHKLQKSEEQSAAPTPTEKLEIKDAPKK